MYSHAENDGMQKQRIETWNLFFKERIWEISHVNVYIVRPPEFLSGTTIVVPIGIDPGLEYHFKNATRV